jgi:hypothetical protein
MATIQGVYLALFGRPADPLGLAFFNSATNNGQNLAGIGPLQSSAEYQTRFAGQSNIQIINSIYQSLFNRDADLPGLTFFANALANGTLTINNIAIAIYDGAQGADRTIRDLKEAAANAFTTAVDTTAEVLGYQGTAAAASARAFIAGVTTTAPTSTQVNTAVAAAVTAGTTGSGGTGATLTLTAGADTIALDATNASLKSTAADDTIRGNLTAGDLGTADSINAGGGVDTLNALLAAGSVAPVLTSVEKIFLTSSADTAALDASAATGTTEIWNNGNAGGFDLAVNNIKLGTTVGLAGTGSDVTTFAFASATGTNDSATLAVNAATYPNAAAVTIAAIENLTITQTTTGAATVAAIVAADAKSVVVTGSGELTLGTGAANNFSKVATINASGHTGNFTLNLEVGVTPTVGQTVLPSAQGVNTIALDTTAAGLTDVIQFNSSNVSTISRLTTVAGFNETIDKLDLKAFALGADTTVASTVVAVAGDINGFFTGTGRVVLNDTTDTVYVDINKDGNFSAGSDLAVVLTGVSAAGFTAADLVLA